METKNIKHCEYCGAEFENTRRNRIYCSPNCVQKASYDRKVSGTKHESDKKGLIHNIDIKDQEIIFNLSEHNDFKEYAKTKNIKHLTNIEFEEYCFFRKKFIGDVDFELFANTISNDDLVEIYQQKESVLYKEFQKFIGEFESGKYKTITGTKTTNKTKERSYDFPTNLK